MSAFHQVSYFDARDVGRMSVVESRRDAATGQTIDIIESSKYGRSLSSSDIAIPKIAHFLRTHWGRSGQQVPEQAVQDAATDFVTSRLQRILGPAENVRRPNNRPYLFVPGRSEQLACPSRNLLDLGQRSASYQVRAQTGQAMWVDPNDTRSLQRAGSVAEEKEYRAHWYGIRYGFNIPETWEEPFTGENIEAERADSAVEAMDDFREMVSFIGDADRKISGFATLDGAPIILGGQSFSSGAIAADVMLRRIGEWEQLYMRANGGMKPSGVVAPQGDRIAMQNARFTGTSDSAWKVGIEQYPWLENAIWDERMTLANAAGTSGRWILYTEDQMKLFIEHLETRVFGPFINEMETTFVLLRRHGGVIAKLPEMVIYVDFTP